MPNPILVTPVAEENLLRILWDDDSLSDYPFAYLRGWCPCAACQGHGGERRFIHVENPQLVSVGMVGNYALNPRWSDGHETGIYTFEYLRGLGDRLDSQSGSNEKG